MTWYLRYQVTSRATTRTALPKNLRAADPPGLRTVERHTALLPGTIKLGRNFTRLRNLTPGRNLTLGQYQVPPGTIKLGRNFTRLRNLTPGRNLTIGPNLTLRRKFTLKIFQIFRGKAALNFHRRRASGLHTARSCGLESCVKLIMLSKSR